MAGLRDGIGMLGEALGLLGGLLGFLGATGIVLFAVSLVLLGLVGAFSPLPKMANYLTIVGLVTGFVLFGFEGFSALPDRAAAVRSYLIVMLAPVAGIYLVSGILRLAFRRRSETEQLREAVTELTEQVAQLRRERQGERPREMLTLDAKRPPRPRVLRRLDRAS